MARTAIVYREEMLAHETGEGHPERPARLTAILDALKAAGLQPPRLDIQPASIDDLLRVHSKRHVVSVQKVCEQGRTYPDPDTPMGPRSWEAALLAAGGGICACKAVLDGSVDNVFCIVRPPGHHAERDWAMGFCLFNNVAIAARWLRDVAQLKRVAILDWDVHHGNGTQHAFYNDETVYYASLHQYPHYPGTGSAETIGTGKGRGYTINLPMAAGAGDREYLAAFRDRIVPALDEFRPEFILISAGFDAHDDDPLSGTILTTSAFRTMTEILKASAEKHCKGRIVSMLEGGYDIHALAESVEEHVAALAT